MAKKRKAKKELTPQQLAARNLDEKYDKRADEVMTNINITKGQYFGISIWKRIRNYVECGKNVAEITYIMERDHQVGRSRTLEIKRLAAKERHKESMVNAREFEDARTQRLASKPPMQNRPVPRTLRNKTSHLPKNPTNKVDPWMVARDASQPSAQKKLTFGAVLTANGQAVRQERTSSISDASKPLKGNDTPAVNIKTYDLPLLHTVTAAKGNPQGVPSVMKKYIPVAQQRDFAVFVHKHRASGKTAKELAAEFLGRSLTKPTKAKSTANESAITPEIINKTDAAELIESKKPEEIPTPQLLDGRDIQGGSTERLVRQRDAAVQAEFRAMVRQNFGGRCAVSGKHLGGILEAAHIEGAELGCYSAGNGILLSPTLHKLFDRHLMGVNPETLTVHFKPGIEFEVYEGHVITPLVYNLDKARLAARWAEYQRG